MEVTWTEWVLIGSMTATVVASLWFISVYSRHTWETTAVGRNVMSVTLGVGVLGVLNAARVVFGPGAWVADLIEAAVWLFVAVSLCKRRYLLSQANRDRHRTLHTDSLGAPTKET